MRESVHAAHKTADLPQRDKLRWGTFCLKLNKGSPFRTTILYVLLHTILMCLKIFLWWTWMCQPVLVTGASLNTQLKNHSSSWFVYKVCAMHAGVFVWGYSLHRPNHSEIGTSIARYPCCILLTGMTIFTLQPTGGTTGSTSRLLDSKRSKLIVLPVTHVTIHTGYGEASLQLSVMLVQC